MGIKQPMNQPYLNTRSLKPENQESPIHFLRQWVTPTDLFFIRNHFPYPILTNQSFFLPIEGNNKKSTVFYYEDLKKMPSVTKSVLLECSGNQRARFRPRVFGEQWKDGAISQGVWKGVSLRTLLEINGLTQNAYEVVFEGYDYGERSDSEGIYHYARSLPIEKALDPDTIIAYELNGYPLPFEQGYPLRLIVPQWYAMASVKWLKRIYVIDHHFEGPYQEIDYNYYPNKETDIGKKPVTNIKVNSIIQQPMDYSELNMGIHKIEGIAWTGEGNIDLVEVSTDDGVSWNTAELIQDNSQAYSWTFFTYNWNDSQKGEHKIISRAKDTSGHVQPPESMWNRKGYGYNAEYKITVKIN